MTPFSPSDYQRSILDLNATLAVHSVLAPESLSGEVFIAVVGRCVITFKDVKTRGKVMLTSCIMHSVSVGQHR